MTPPTVDDLILESLRELRQELTEVRQDHVTLIRDVGALRTDLKSEITALKIRSSMWGAVSGFFATLAALIMTRFRGG